MKGRIVDDMLDKEVTDSDCSGSSVDSGSSSASVSGTRSSPASGSSLDVAVVLDQMMFQIQAQTQSMVLDQMTFQVRAWTQSLQPGISSVAAIMADEHESAVGPLMLAMMDRNDFE